MQSKGDIQYELKALRDEFNLLTERRKKATEKEEEFLSEAQKAISKKISDIEWSIKTPSEKQEYRKAIINLSKKWGTMKGAVQSSSHPSSLECLIEFYDLGTELLKFEDLSQSIKDQIKVLQEEINRNRP